MGPALSAKQLLANHNIEQYQAFLVTNDEQLTLPVLSSVPGIVASKRYDYYTKTCSHPGKTQHIKFISKNDKPHAFVWQTTSQQLKKAVRWGIIHTHSTTGKVLSALGQYRVIAYERIAKGMMSNSQSMKLKLLDLFQDRFEALEDLESLVNKNNSLIEYETAINAYITKLQSIDNQFSSYFTDEQTLPQFTSYLHQQIRTDLQKDILRAQNYLDSLKQLTRSPNRARGQDSILEFVKQQMVHGLYELQGLNQDLTYSKERHFALTRGELNDFIEDARKIIDDNDADLRNSVTAKHHGIFAKKDEELISYNFAEDELSPERERQILLAISFIEGWDTLDAKSGTLNNQYGSESLDLITATQWQNHRTVLALLTSFGYFLLNFFKSIVLPTYFWEEESWKNKNFHLVASELRAHCKPNEPMWKKPIKLFQHIAYAFFDLFQGIRDFGAQLSVKMPEDLVNDWHSCSDLEDLTQVFKEADAEIASLSKLEDERLKTVLTQCNYASHQQPLSPATSHLAQVEYALTNGEHNDLLSSMAHGLNEFAAVFSHNLYAKDPIAGLVFTAAYAVGAGAIYLPSATSTIFGPAYVQWFTNFGYSLGSSPLAAVISAGSTQAQGLATLWDALVHGPSGIAMNAFYKIGEDPITIGAYLATAGIVGHLLVNGIAGHTIPWFSEFLKEDMGTVPEASEPFIGGKFLIGIYEAFIRHKSIHDHHPKLTNRAIAEDLASQKKEAKQQRIIHQFLLASWLSANAKNLRMLQAKQKFALSRQITALFPKNQANSLNKLLYPEAHQTIAFQIFSLPLSYIPALLRILAALIILPCAWALNKPHPWAPLKNASLYLFNKIAKDLSRILYFMSLTAYFIYTGFVTVPRALIFSCTLLIGRIAGFFDLKPGHGLHQCFASINTFYRTAVEWFYPTSILTSVEVANPVHTINEVDDSFKKLVQQLGVTPKEEEEELGSTGIAEVCSNKKLPTFRGLSLSDPHEFTHIPLAPIECLSPSVARAYKRLRVVS